MKIPTSLFFNQNKLLFFFLHFFPDITFFQSTPRPAILGKVC